MAEFTFVGRLSNGQTQKGTLNARDRTAAITLLRARQFQSVTVKETRRSGGFNISFGPGKVKSRDLVIFTREFATMVNAGVPILRSLTILRDQSDSATLRKTLEAVTADVQGGVDLSTAMSKHPHVFSPIYVNMVRAGESGGILDTVLGRLAYQQEKDNALRGKVRGAMTYPAVILTVTLGAFFVLMTFIVPKIGSILTSLSGGSASLPIYTQALLTISDIMKQPITIVGTLVGLPLLFVGFRRYIKTKNGRYRWHSFILKIPVVKVIVAKTAIARFSRVFASLMGAGVSIVEAIDTTAAAIGNAVIEKELLACSKAIQAGSQLSAELQKSKHFPPIVAQMLAVGEETGKTDEVILKVAEFYEEEVDTAVGAMSSIIEPITILLLGGMIGIIALSVFGPITQISTSVQS